MAAEDKAPGDAAQAPDAAAKKAEPKQEDDLSEEDQALKEELDLLVTRAMDSDSGVQKLALETIRSEIRSATASMTSVPKPLKFLRPHFDPLKSYYFKQIRDAPNKVFLADVLSILSMTMGDSSRCESLRFKLRGSDELPHLWGHEYVRHLAGEIAQEYRSIVVGDVMAIDKPPESGDDPLSGLLQGTAAELSKLVSDIVPFLISSNAEPEAVDLLIEVDALPELVQHSDEHNYSRVCLYLKSCADYFPDQADVHALLQVAADIYIKVGKLPEAMQVALRKGNVDMIQSIYKTSEPGSSVRTQLALDLGRAGVLLPEETELSDDLRTAMRNSKLSAQFLSLAKDLDVLDPKTPDDIYKQHLLESRAAMSTTVDSARTNLAKTFVNAFVNMGFGTDKLMSQAETEWIYLNKDHGMMSAAASVGMIRLWDVEAALEDIDKYLYLKQEYVRAGALLAIGLVSANVQHEVDPPLAILAEHVASDTACVRHGSIAGLGLAYAGVEKEKLKEILLPVLMDGDVPADTASFAALTLGLSFIGTADEELSTALLQVMSDRKATGEASKEPLVQILLPLAFGFLFLGQQYSAEAAAETINAVVGEDSMMGRVAAITLQACAHAGSGNVIMVQKFLSICGKHVTPGSGEEGADASSTQFSNSDKKHGTSSAAVAGSGDTDIVTQEGDGAPATPSASAGGAATTATSDGAGEESKSAEDDDANVTAAEQAVCVLGIAMISMGEELGAEMAIRMFGHLLQYGDAVIRRVVPLAIGLLSVSNPKLTLMDMLSKFTHDSDMDVAQSAIVGLGFIGAGTNNSRIAGILRQLSVYYSKEPASLFLVRISQGLLHSAKGLVTLNPFYGDKFLSSKSAFGGLLTVLFSCLDMKGTILGKNHFLLFYLALAARPRMVFTVDENMEFKATSVRVGQSVDTVGQAGRPKSITGFQTHTTPVLLAAGERAELATEEFRTVASSLESIIVLEKNPDWVDESGLAEQAAKAQQSQLGAGKDEASSSATTGKAPAQNAPAVKVAEGS